MARNYSLRGLPGLPPDYHYEGGPTQQLSSSHSGAYNFETTVNASITGVSSTCAVGTVTPSVPGISASISGVVSTGAAATATASVAAAPTGVSGTGSAGTLGVENDHALTGVASTGAAGTLRDEIDIALSGASGTGAAGAFTIQSSSNITLTGAAATGSAGTLSASVSLTLAGASGTGQVGSLTASPRKSLTGVSATGQVGAVIIPVNATVQLGTPSAAAWQLKTTSGPTLGSNLTYGNGVFIADDNSSSSLYNTSTDGITWTQRTPTIGFNPASVLAFGNGVFVSYVTDNVSATSTDGVTWTTHSTSYTAPTFMTFVDGVFYGGANPVGGGTPYLLTSSDGINWAFANVFSGTTFGKIVGSSSLLVTPVSLSPHYAAFSTDGGATWSYPSAPPANNQQIIYGDGLFVALTGSNTFYTSPDGDTWTSRTDSNLGGGPFGPLIFAPEYGLFLSTGATVGATAHRGAYSQDGITWSVVPAMPAGATNQKWLLQVCVNGVFYAYTNNFVSSNAANIATLGPIDAYSIAAVGTTAPSLAKTLSGAASACAAGSLTAQYSGQGVISGVAATGAVGSVSVTIQDTLGAATATGTVGVISASITLPSAITGVVASGIVAAVVPDVQPGIAGVSATGSVGTLQISEALEASITGVEGDGQVGVLVASDVAVISGVSASGAVGAVSVPTLVVTGVSATGSAGSLTVTEAVVVSSVSASGQATAPATELDTVLVGVAALGATGTLTISTSVSASVTLTGVQSLCQVGHLDLGGNITHPAVGGPGDHDTEEDKARQRYLEWLRNKRKKKPQPEIVKPQPAQPTPKPEPVVIAPALRDMLLAANLRNQKAQEVVPYATLYGEEALAQDDEEAMSVLFDFV